MPRILDRYLLREAFWLFWAGLVTFVFVLISSRVIYEIFDYLYTVKLAKDVVWRLFLTQLPRLALESTPGALLFAVFLATGRLSRELESPTMFWAGISPARTLVPYMFLACLVMGLIWWFRETYAIPYQAAYMNLKKVYVQGEGEERTVNDAVFRVDKDRLFYAKLVDLETGMLDHVLVLRRDGSRLTSLMSAPTATWTSQSITLHQGAAADKYGDALTQSLKTVDRTIFVGRPVGSLRTTRLDPTLLTLPELRQQIRFKRQSGLEVRELLTEYFLRYSFPFSCVVIVLFTVPLGYRLGRQEQLVNGVLAVFMVSFYWGVMAVARSLANKGALEPLLGENAIPLLAWSQNIILVCLGSVVLLVHRLVTR